MQKWKNETDNKNDIMLIKNYTSDKNEKRTRNKYSSRLP